MQWKFRAWLSLHKRPNSPQIPANLNSYVKVPLRYPAASFLPNLASDYMKIYPKHVAENLTQDQANKGIGQEAAMAAI